MIAYYEKNQTWDGVDPKIIHNKNLTAQSDPYRAVNANLILMNANGKVIAPLNSTFIGKEMATFDLEPSLPIIYKGQTIGFLSSSMLISNLPNVFAEEFNLLFSRSILIALLASGFIAMIYALVATNSVVQPIVDMTEMVEKMAGGNLDLRVNSQKYGYQNLVTLAQSINYLAKSVQQSEDQRREMISDVAHELRTPLAVQKSYLEAMEDEIVPFNKDSLKTLQDQNLLLTRLVNDLRLLSLAESGELNLVLRQLDLTQLLTGVLKQFQSKFDEMDLTVKLKASKPHPIILGDPDRIEQIVNNLFQNESRYAPPGTNLDVSCEIEDHHAVLSVRDYGVGVLEEEREAIFVRFFRTDKSKQTFPSGFGLGLPIARKLAEAHGGTLTASDPVGKGVVFKLVLPLSYEPISYKKNRHTSVEKGFFN
ncbi:MAG: ATP-binding protein [Anaerolineaceae bacterium]|nr:ATP-binding protein [Anaerolineaceae bacterium]